LVVAAAAAGVARLVVSRVAGAALHVGTGGVAAVALTAPAGVGWAFCGAGAVVAGTGWTGCAAGAGAGATVGAGTVVVTITGVVWPPPRVVSANALTASASAAAASPIGCHFTLKENPKCRLGSTGIAAQVLGKGNRA
jgi:hypothetical protein